MKVVIAGGTGLIGTAIARSLAGRADVVVLSRSPGTVQSGRGVRWAPGAEGEWVDEVREADAVINLAGAGIADKRWSETRKRELWNSRIESTGAIVEALGSRSSTGRPCLVSASAIGYYGPRGDEELDESSPPGEGFLSELSIAWEAEARRAAGFARVVILRIGIVLAREGGALAAMLPVFKLGLGGPLGSGRQWMSWIHIDDLVAMFEAAIDGGWEGVFNAVGPEPVRNSEFGKTLGKALHRPAFLPAPGPALRVLLGEMAGPLLLSGQRVVPAAALARGFTFRYPSLETALDELARR
jgi:uncharacterized protein (TIGR01777 family)